MTQKQSMVTSLATVAFSFIFVGVATSAPVLSSQQVRGAECGSGNTRITDRAWYRDLFLSDRVSVDDATLIVRALRRGDIENKQPFPSEGQRAGIAPPMPFIDANQISLIAIEPTVTRGFRLQTGCGSGNWSPDCHHQQHARIALDGLLDSLKPSVPSAALVSASRNLRLIGV